MEIPQIPLKPGRPQIGGNCEKNLKLLRLRNLTVDIFSGRFIWGLSGGCLLNKA